MRGRGGCGISHVLDFPHEPCVRRATQETRGTRLISTPTPSRLRCGGLISCFAEQTITIHATREVLGDDQLGISSHLAASEP